MAFEHVGRQAECGSIEVVHDWGGPGSIAETIITALAEEEGVDPVDLEPLYGWIDPEALDSLFSPQGETADPDAYVVFQYGEYRVVAGADGTVVIESA
ncbi:HalOD1 output domain-containing protein [Natronorarus salvus]|uniref:HalOD1 output domain-containing protein n=1 Tax=Natronorarus salvus TaxID=3117733 RepID=UPI002F26388E